jgi:arylsulfatase A-like enzyme
MRERDLSDKQEWVADPDGSFVHPTVPTITGNRAQQLRTLRSVDDMVAQVFGEMRRLGQSNDTLAVFLSDNGFLWGEHGLAGNRAEAELGPIGVTGKRYPYLPSVRVPFAMRWPGHIPEGVRADGYASTVDLAPTILQAAGLRTPADPPMDGRSLLLPGNTGLRAGPSSVYLEYFDDPLYPAIPSWSSILAGEAQYVRWFDARGRTIAREYYDLTSDPFELDNLLGDPDPANDPDTTALDARIDRDRACAGTTGDRACR